MSSFPSFLNLIDKGYFNIIFVALSMLIILIPRLCGYHDSLLNKSPANVAIASPEAQLSYGILLVSTLPSLIDTILDYQYYFNEAKWKKYIFGRVPIVVTGFLFSVQLFTINNTPSIFGVTSSTVGSYLFTLCSFRLIFTGSAMLILTSMKPTVFTGKLTSLFTLFICFYVVIRTFLSGSTTSFQQLAAILNYIFVVVVVTTLIYWLVKLARTTKIMTVSEYICLLYLLIYYISLFGSYMHVFLAWGCGIYMIDFTAVTSKELAVMNYCFSFAFIVLSIAPGRIARFEAVTNLVRRHILYNCHYIHVYLYMMVIACICAQNQVIDTKKAYVRFIGHELRTPLNSVFMGMQLSIGQIPEDTQVPAEIERRETLLDSQSACGAALDILNEMLLFDKLESGSLILRKQDVPVPELVEDSLKSFFVQAREKRIELSITNNEENTCVPAVSSKRRALTMLYDEDEVTVDKYKVIQVIRNVVSNALKFTPASGKIQVNVRFEPRAQWPGAVEESPPTNSCCGRSILFPLVVNSDGDHVAIDMSVMRRLAPIPISSSKKQLFGELVIEIKDNGVGISEENQRRLFKEVVQFSPELLQNGGGSGLGMCISKNLMDMHGGAISVYSEGVGHGSMFILRLPMVRRSTTSDSEIYTPTLSSLDPGLVKESPSVSRESYVQPIFPERLPNTFRDTSTSDVHSSSRHKPVSVKEVPAPERAPPEPSGAQMRFLVVDDSKMNRKMLCRLLQTKGHVYDEAEDGVEAVAMMTAALSISSLEASEDAAACVDSESETAATATNTQYDAVLMDFM